MSGYRLYTVSTLTLVTATALILSTLYVWPTRYRYDQIKRGENTAPVRIDRISGVAEYLTPRGWKVATTEEQPIFGPALIEDDSNRIASSDEPVYQQMKQTADKLVASQVDRARAYLVRSLQNPIGKTRPKAVTVVIREHSCVIPPPAEGLIAPYINARLDRTGVIFTELWSQAIATIRKDAPSDSDYSEVCTAAYAFVIAQGWEIR